MDQEALRRILREAHIPALFAQSTFTSYPLSPETRPAWEDARRWAYMAIEGEDPRDDVAMAERAAWMKYGLFLWGPYGSGKTGLAVSVLHVRFAERGSWGLFIRVPDLLDAIRATYGPGSETQEHELLDLVKRSEIVVLDDIGSERPTEWVKEKLCSIVGYRHDEKLDTVFTSNLSLEALSEHIGERTVHRIAEMCRVVEVTGPDLRKRRVRQLE